MPLGDDLRRELPAIGVQASWYGEPHHGRPTASGERFDRNRLTAAHPRLPFGTILKVTNLDNGRQVFVRVNDRGPFSPKRDLDVSEAAARRLGMLDAGEALVSIDLVERDELAEARRMLQEPAQAAENPARRAGEMIARAKRR